MVPGTDLLTLAEIPWESIGLLGALLLASIASGAVAFPVARALNLAQLFKPRRRCDPEATAATLIACASVARKPGFNPRATASADPLLIRAVALAASDAPIDLCIADDPPSAPRPIIAWAPVVGLVLALAGLAAAVSVVSTGSGLGASGGIAVVVAMFSAFFLSTAASAVDDRAGRLDPADVLVRAMIAAAVPAIRGGASPATVEQILRPLLPPQPTPATAGRLAA